MNRSAPFNKGDVILTNPETGFWGIAIVLSERDRTKEFLPTCHIAITPLIRLRPIGMRELEASDLKPLVFARGYRTVPNGPIYVMETRIGVYTRRNKPGLTVLGKIDPLRCYSGPLPFSPDHGSDVKWPLCGDVTPTLGYEALVQMRRSQ